MITARATSDDGKQIVILGVSRENIRRLLDGQPIRVMAETHPGFIENLVLCILFGETERDIAMALKPLITESTKVITTPKDPSGQVS